MTTKKTTKPRAPKVPKKPLTQEQILASIGTLFDQVEEIMSQRDTGKHARIVQWTRSYYGDLADVTTKLQPLLEKLDTVACAAKPQGFARGRPDDADFGGPEVLMQHFSTAPGSKLTWSRPGRFLVWMGDIPVRCLWGGFALSSQNAATALNPRKMFMSNDGAVELYVGTIEPGDADPEAILRKRIMQRLHVRSSSSRGYTSPPPLVQLSRAGIERVNSFRADPANAWWLEACAGSPVDAIPLPLDLPVVQTSLFG